MPTPGIVSQSTASLTDEPAATVATFTLYRYMKAAETFKSSNGLAGREMSTAELQWMHCNVMLELEAIAGTEASEAAERALLDLFIDREGIALSTLLRETAVDAARETRSKRRRGGD